MNDILEVWKRCFLRRCGNIRAYSPKASLRVYGAAAERYLIQGASKVCDFIAVATREIRARAGNPVDAPGQLKYNVQYLFYRFVWTSAAENVKMGNESKGDSEIIFFHRIGCGTVSGGYNWLVNYVDVFIIAAVRGRVIFYIRGALESCYVCGIFKKYIFVSRLGIFLKERSGFAGRKMTSTRKGKCKKTLPEVINFINKGWKVPRELT